MKKMLLVLFMTSMGFASNAWSAQADMEKGLEGFGEAESLKMVPRPRPIKPPLLEDTNQN